MTQRGGEVRQGVSFGLKSYHRLQQRCERRQTSYSLASISPSRSRSSWIRRSVSSFSALRSRTDVTWSDARAAISVFAARVYESICAQKYQ